MHNKIYITIVVVVYAVVATVFLVFPRSTYSELEKRELAQMPEFSTSKLRDNSYPKELAAWFSDSEPYRDQLMATSMWVRDKLRLSLGDDEAILMLRGEETECVDLHGATVYPPMPTPPKSPPTRTA